MCLLHCPSGQFTSSEVELKLGSASMQRMTLLLDLIHAEPTSGGMEGGGGGRASGGWLVL